MAKCDVFGEALMAFHEGKLVEPLILHNSYGEDEEMPIDVFFRDEEEFPELEHIALALCDGKVLDVGAGAGSHALSLQKQQYEVTALEISSMACKLMQYRSVKRIIHGDIFSYKGDTFDTLLFLMNGIGLAENISGLKRLLQHCKELLRADGQLLFDSSDIGYLYHPHVPPSIPYFGEVTFQYEYQGQKGDTFSWLYIDQATLIKIAQADGWVVQILYEDENDQYLARLSLRV